MKDCTMFLCEYPVALPLAIAVVLVAIATAWVAWASAGKFRPWWSMGSGTWDFAGSWASNITAGGAIATAIMGGTGTALGDRADYLALNVLFVAIAIAAPCVFNFVRKPSVNGSTTELIGFAGMFLLAAVATIWATYGQLIVFGLAVREASSADKPLISPALAGPLYTVAVVIAIALVPYLVQTIYASLARQKADGLQGETPAPTAWTLL